MTTTLLLVVLGPPALFGLMLLWDEWRERRRNRHTPHPVEHCPVCAEYARNREDHPSGRHLGPPDEWLP